MIPIEELNQIPYRLREISDPPEKLYIQGNFPDEEMKFLTVVGSRKHTPYGKAVCQKLIEKLKGYPIVIVSGLALGLDAIAHSAAIDAGLKTLAVPGSGLGTSVLYPKTNYALSKKILESGGCLVSEFEPKFKATRWSFIQRNRIMAGLSDAVLIIEAEEKSGTLATARLATDYNRELLVIPGQISSPTSKGTNELIRQGATPITKSADILEALGIDTVEQKDTQDINLTGEEKEIYELINYPITKEEISAILNKDISDINISITMLEIKGVITQNSGKINRT